MSLHEKDNVMYVESAEKCHITAWRDDYYFMSRLSSINVSILTQIQI